MYQVRIFRVKHTPIYISKGLSMKFSVIFLAIFSLFSSVVMSNKYSLNFSDESDSQKNSYAFISKNYSQANTFLTHSGYKYRNTLDSFLVLTAADTLSLDSLAYLASQKDDHFIESSHSKYVPQFFIFRMDSIYSKLGDDSIVTAILKWKGEISPALICKGNFSIKIPQAGHGCTPRLDTSGNVLKGDMSDTSYALHPSWFRSSSFFNHELVIQPIITNLTDSITTLRTDFIEVVLISSGKTEILMRSVRNSASKIDLKIFQTGATSINIQYKIIKNSFFSLDLFSSNGVLIKQLDRGIKSTGSYRAEWDGRSTIPFPGSNGKYIVRLSDGTNVKAAVLSVVK